jgi:hypothetical protein
MRACFIVLAARLVVVIRHFRQVVVVVLSVRYARSRRGALLGLGSSL